MSWLFAMASYAETMFHSAWVASGSSCRFAVMVRVLPSTDRLAVCWVLVCTSWTLQNVPVWFMSTINSYVCSAS